MKAPPHDFQDLKDLPFTFFCCQRAQRTSEVYQSPGREGTGAVERGEEITFVAVPAC